MPNTLFIRLEGPLQAWGERARWSVRDTAQEPTKSGVVGLLACALGLGDDAAIRDLSRQIDIGVRCDRPGQRLVDYHTVVGGVMSAQGKIKITESTKERETVVSWRSYLCDASFLAAVRSGEELVTRLADALQSPYWPIYLGRRSCPPSKPVYAGTGDYPTIEAALAEPDLVLRQREAGDSTTAETTRQVRAVISSSPSNGVRRRDEIDALSRRTYLPRYTQDVMIRVRVAYE